MRRCVGLLMVLAAVLVTSLQPVAAEERVPIPLVLQEPPTPTSVAEPAPATPALPEASPAPCGGLADYARWYEDTTRPAVAVLDQWDEDPALISTDEFLAAAEQADEAVREFERKAEAGEVPTAAADFHAVIRDTLVALAGLARDAAATGVLLATLSRAETFERLDARLTSVVADAWMRCGAEWGDFLTAIYDGDVPPDLAHPFALPEATPPSI